MRLLCHWRLGPKSLDAVAGGESLLCLLREPNAYRSSGTGDMMRICHAAIPLPPTSGAILKPAGV